jgi:hypothetical protein
MADDEWTQYPGLGTGDQGSSDESPTYGDYGKTLASGATGAAAGVAGLARRATDGVETAEGRFANAMSKVLQKSLNETTDDINASRSASAKQRAEAAVTSPEFWNHPISSTMLKATGMTAPMAAMVFSGGVIGAAVVGGALSAGSYDNEVDKILDGATDEKLKDNAWYANLRSMGMDEDDARASLKNKLIGGKDAYNFAAGAIAGVLGPAGKLAAGVTGRTAAGLATAETGAAARAALGAAEGGVGNAAQAGVADATLQQTPDRGGNQEELRRGRACERCPRRRCDGRAPRRRRRSSHQTKIQNHPGENHQCRRNRSKATRTRAWRAGRSRTSRGSCRSPRSGRQCRPSDRAGREGASGKEKGESQG